MGNKDPLSNIILFFKKKYYILQNVGEIIYFEF